MIADERVVVRDKNSDFIAKELALKREKIGFRIPKKNPEVFKMEKTYVD